MEDQRTRLSGILSQALSMTDQRLNKVPDHSMLNGIKNQLRTMQEKVQEGNTPTPGEKKSMNLGVLAVREIEDFDPEYARLLMKASAQYKKL